MPVNPILPNIGGDQGVWGETLNEDLLGLASEINTHEGAIDPHGDRQYADDNKLDKSQNLSDLSSVTAALGNLGLDPAGLAAAIQAALNANPLVNQ